MKGDTISVLETKRSILITSKLTINKTDMLIVKITHYYYTHFAFIGEHRMGRTKLGHLGSQGFDTNYTIPLHVQRNKTCKM